MALTKVTRHGQITLPRAVREELQIEEGDIIEVRVEGDSIVLAPKKLIDKSQAYFWTEEWQQGEREADEDIRAGRIQVFGSLDELLKELEE